ncbi:hypothetical protein ACI65C_011420 [Semiaphis heraclei]
MRAHRCARVFSACLLPPPAYPLPGCQSSCFAVAAATASVSVRSECSVLVVARQRHTRFAFRLLRGRRRSVINSFRVLAAITCATITPTVSSSAIHIDRLCLAAIEIDVPDRRQLTTVAVTTAFVQCPPRSGRHVTAARSSSEEQRTMQ